MDKSEIRKKFKNIRENLRGSITSEFFESKIYNECESIFTFVSYGSEISTFELIDRALMDKKNVAVPYMTGIEHKMVFIKINGISELKPNKISILEPEYKEENIFISDRNTIIIVPGLAFDREFYRIGYGGGFYDKYIDENDYRATIGVCFEEQITDFVPRAEFDRCVDFIVTDKRILWRREYENLN